MNPREYQVWAVQALFNYFQKQAGNPVLALPTGTGKSVIIAMCLQMIYHQYPNQRVMMLTHVKELIEQNYSKLLTLWPGAPAGVYSAGLNRKEFNRKITFAGIGSVVKRAKTFGHIDLIFVDEAHRVTPAENTMYQKFIGELRMVNPYLKVVGLTATPWQEGVGIITDNGIFTDIPFDMTGMEAFNWLIDKGYLAPLVPKKTSFILDVNGVHMRGGDYIASELQKAVDKQEITQAALREVLEVGHDRRHWLAFATGVEHACNIADMLNDMGISSIAIHSKMGDKARDKAIEDFKKGVYRCAVNYGVLTTGFDFPAIDLIIMLRPTGSTVLWVQMLGRGTRPFECAEYKKENCLVLDFANNTRNRGPINDPVLPRKKGEKGGDAPVKLCEACNTWNHASVRNCACCGAEFTFKVKIEQTASNAELIRADAPIVEVFAVDHITYSTHEKVGRPIMMKATYYCGLRSFTEYVCIQHDGFAQRKAKQWWRERSAAEFPPSVEDALMAAEHIAPATHLRVWINKKYPEILNHCFDGTAFGHQAATPPPTSDSSKQAARVRPAAVNFDDMDDDIPF